MGRRNTNHSLFETRPSPHTGRCYARRKEPVERSFADAKQLHGHRYARMRGLRKVAEQCLLAAAARNIKKIALVLARPFIRLCWLIAQQSAHQGVFGGGFRVVRRRRAIPAWAG
jgi:hypothetical protein